MLIIGIVLIVLAIILLIIVKSDGFRGNYSSGFLDYDLGYLFLFILLLGLGVLLTLKGLGII
jgi:hypothetical protein